MPKRPQYPSVDAHAYDHDAPLVAAPSAITRRALERIGAGTLYTLLHLETLTADDLPSQQQSGAKARLAAIEREYSRWREVEAHMCAAIIAATDIPNVDGYGLQVTERDRAPIRFKMVDVLEIFASAAANTAGRFLEVDHGDIGTLPGKLAVARRMADLQRSRRKELTARSVRSRLLKLLGALPGWTPGAVAELIIASQHDWNPAPVQLAPKYRFDPADLDDPDRIASGRARQRREALLQWIRDQRKAVVAPAGPSPPKRRRKRENQ